MSINAGKPVYIEKPLIINSNQTEQILNLSNVKGIKATGAYYRRRLPLFEKVKSLISTQSIGQIRTITISIAIPARDNNIAKSDTNWRIDPEISGGGLFHDLAPHMLDILIWIFGAPKNFNAQSLIQTKGSHVADYVTLSGEFDDRIGFDGKSLFETHATCKEDICVITGSKGKISFPFFELRPLELTTDHGTEHLSFENHANIQFNMIRDTVAYFQGTGQNPCPLEEVLVSMKMLDTVGS